MSYKTIVVLIDRAWRVEQLEVAFALAADMDAHLVGLYAVRTPGIPSFALAEAASVAVKLQELQRADRAAREDAARKAFEAAAKHSGHAKHEWRVTRADALMAVAQSARYADLIIAAQPQPKADEAGNPPESHSTLALVAGRPVLHVPYVGRFAHLARRVMVAWSATRESARAVTDSLPLLRQAESVRVVVFNPGSEHGEQPGADVALYLARHGVKVAVVQRKNTEVGIGELILSDAADDNADLIVMGAYGHSRIRELVLGGATRTVLESMTVPVLMSH